MMGTVQNYSLLCCFALFFLLPHHLMADASAKSADSFRAPESTVAQMQQPAAAIGMQNSPPGELSDIHDIYGPLPLPQSPSYRLYGYIAFLAAAFGALLIVLLRFRNKQEKTTDIDPASLALAALRKAETTHGKTGDLSHYCDEVSATLRTYVEQVSGYRVSSRTTLESLNELKSKKELTSFVENDRLELLRRCFTRCDMVKFARYSPDQAEIEHIGGLAASFISTTNSFRTGAS